jgi:hypothetical protein
MMFLHMKHAGGARVSKLRMLRAMYDTCLMPSRSVVEQEQLVVHKFPSGALGLAAATDVGGKVDPGTHGITGFFGWLKRNFLGVIDDSDGIPEVQVPTGTYLILKSIPGVLRNRYGLEEEEGVVLLHSSSRIRNSIVLEFNNGAQIRLQELREGQPIEVLSFALADVSIDGPCDRKYMRRRTI